MCQHPTLYYRFSFNSLIAFLVLCFLAMPSAYAQKSSYTYNVSKGGTLLISWDSLGITNANVDRYSINNAPSHGSIARSESMPNPADVWYTWGSANFNTNSNRVFKTQTLRYIRDNTTGSETISITFWQGGFSPFQSSITITTGGVNQQPIANADTVSAISEDETYVYWYESDFLTNDSDPDGGSLSVSGVQDKSKAGCSVMQSGSRIHYYPGGFFTYLKDGQSYKDELYYILSDGNGGTATGTIYVTINGKNSAPIASEVSASGIRNTNISIALSASDPEGDPLTYTIVTTPPKGKLYKDNSGALGAAITSGNTVISGNKVLFVPNTNEYGSNYTSFYFKASDGKLDSNVGTATVNVTYTNTSPQVSNMTATGNEDSDVLITLSGFDLDGDALAYVITKIPPKGTLYTVVSGLKGAQINTANFVIPGNLVIFVPNSNESGTTYATFQFKANDGTAESNTATATIDITAVNDPPSTVADTAVTFQNKAVFIPVLSNDTDIEGDALSVQSTTQGANGSVTITYTDVTYTPNEGFNGSDTFTYTAIDSQGGTAQGNVTVTVYPLLTVSAGDNQTGFMSTTFNLTATVQGGTGNYSYEWAVVQSPQDSAPVINGHDAANATFSSNVRGMYTIQLNVNDGMQPPMQAIVDIELINQEPQFESTPWPGTEEYALYIYDISVTDPDGDSVILSLSKAPSWLDLIKTDEGIDRLTGTAPALDPDVNTMDFEIEILASDGITKVSQLFTLTVGKSSTAFPPVVGVKDWLLY